jgi:probable HAF family extracellular repeat protein
MFSASTLIRHLGSAFTGRPVEPNCRRVAFKRRPKSSPCMEPLEDRRLQSYTITNLSSLGGRASVPVDVNNHGEVVGYSFTANNAAGHAFLYSHGRMTDLGTLGGRDSAAAAINDKGAVVGASLTSASALHDFIDLRRRMVDLTA